MSVAHPVSEILQNDEICEYLIFGFITQAGFLKRPQSATLK